MSLFEHAVVALLIQIAVGLSTRNWWAGAALACGYFIGREFAQAEYRWIEQFGHGLRGSMPWWRAFDTRVWPKLDQWADLFGPLCATLALALVMHRRAGSKAKG